MLQIDGLNEVLNRIEQMGNNAEKLQNKVVNAQSEILLDTMKKTIQVDTGRTRDSLKASGVLTKEGEKYKLVGAYKSDRAHIVRVLERGCSAWKGRKYPFLRPSFYKCKNEMIEKSKEVIQKEMMKD
nr:HK97-gp10 family putative phage morphogenesis protein [uncultured Cellulosilyticum sp.]